jgi:uncharacterized phage protein (TIGR02220 family)
MNSYELSRNFTDWCFDNPHKVKPIHYAIFYFSIEHCNRLGWKENFGFPSQMVMEAIGVKNWRTYSSGLNELAEFGFIKIIEKSQNQYSSNIIAIVNFTKAHTKPLDKALSNHHTNHSQTTVSIDKQDNNKQINNNAIDFDIFLDWFNKTTNRNFKSIPEATKKSFKARLKEGYTKEDIMKAVINCSKDKFHIENPKYLTPEFISRADKLAVYLNAPNVVIDSRNPKNLPIEL